MARLCGQRTRLGRPCMRPLVGGRCGTNHSAGRIQGLATRATKTAGRGVARKGAEAAGASTIGMGRAGVDAVLHPDPMQVDTQYAKGAKKGAATGRRAVPRRRAVITSRDGTPRYIEVPDDDE